MATLTVPKKRGDVPEPMAMDQKRPYLDRFRVMVDRLTKFSFKTLDEAVKTGSEIKKKFPKVQVSIYDATDNETKVLD